MALNGQFLDKSGLEHLWSKLKDQFSNKVDKVSGKSLSTNDYTTAEKTKLSGIETGANKTTVDSGLSSTSTNPVQNKIINTALTDIRTSISNEVTRAETAESDMDTRIAENQIDISALYAEIAMLRASSDIHHYGFKIDKSIADPSKNVTYTHDAVGMTPAFMDYTADTFNYGSWKDAWFMKNCYPVALKFDGTEDYKLDPNDYRKKADGTASDVANSSYQGNFMMAFPIVWFKRYEDDSYNYIEIADRKLDDTFEAFAHIDKDGNLKPYIYLPLFKGTIVDGKLRSIADANPENFTTANAEISAAESCGDHWQIWDHSSRELINDLLTLIGRSTNSQTTFGKGRESGYVNDALQNYGILKTGTLTDKGSFYGSNSSTNECKVFGMESLWANRWDRMQGLLSVNGVYKVKMTPPYNLTGTDFITPSGATMPTANGWLKTLSTSKYGSLPSAVGGSSSTYYADLFYSDASGTRVARVGGHCNSGSDDGFRYVNMTNTASYSYWHVGASPVFK